MSPSRSGWGQALSRWREWWRSVRCSNPRETALLRPSLASRFGTQAPTDIRPGNSSFHTIMMVRHQRIRCVRASHGHAQRILTIVSEIKRRPTPAAVGADRDRRRPVQDRPIAVPPHAGARKPGESGETTSRPPPAHAAMTVMHRNRIGCRRPIYCAAETASFVHSRLKASVGKPSTCIPTRCATLPAG